MRARGGRDRHRQLLPRPVRGGAVVAAIVALAGGGWAASTIVFLVISVLVLLFVRPIARRHLRQGPHAEDRHGRARRAHARSCWRRSPTTRASAARASTARSGRRARSTTTASSRPGERVHVIEIRGATALVTTEEGAPHGRAHRSRRAGPLRALRRVHDRPHHPAGSGGRRRAPRPLQPHAPPGAGDRHPVHRPGAAAHRPARAGRAVPAAAGDHRGQPHRADRHGPVLHDHRGRSPRPTRSPTRCRRSSS